MPVYGLNRGVGLNKDKIIFKGNVLYQRKQIPANEALKKTNLQPLNLYAKDALSIFSSNAYTACMATLTVYDAENLINKYDLLVSLSLEGINGNIAPFLEPVQAIRHFPGQDISAQNIINNLQGSYLFNTSTKRALQDPLSFRTASKINHRFCCYSKTNYSHVNYLIPCSWRY